MAGSLYGISKINEITPHLYLTSVYGATRENIIKYNCTLLVNCAQELPKQDLNGVESIKLFLDDMPYAIINVYFDRIADKIHEHANRGGRTMIHCVCGISRAASISIAYLMKYKNMSLRSAYDYISVRRPCIRPNQGFWRQLTDYEKRLNSSSSQNEVSNQSSLKRETPIPITIVSTAAPAAQQPQYSSYRSNSVRGLNQLNYSTPSAGISSQNDYESQRPFIQTRYGSSNLYTRNTTNRSSSISKLYNTINQMPTKNDYVAYETTSYPKQMPTTHHRSSILLENFNDPRPYLPNGSAKLSTTYKTSFDRY